MELVQHLPSIIAGSAAYYFNMIKLLDTTKYNQDVDQTLMDLKKFSYTIFGDNPFGSTVREFIQESDKICKCFEVLELPTCFVDHWPIPLSGTSINSAACAISYGCSFVDLLAVNEASVLEACLPIDTYRGSSSSCESVITSCSNKNSIIFNGLVNIPLPGAFRRIYHSLRKNDLVDKIDHYYTKCVDNESSWTKHLDFEAAPQANNNEEDNEVDRSFLAFTAKFVMQMLTFILGMVTAGLIFMYRQYYKKFDVLEVRVATEDDDDTEEFDPVEGKIPIFA